MSHPRAWLAYCGTCQRIREIMIHAPWSNFDLMTSVIVCGIGGYLLFMPGMFQAIGGVYSGMARLGPEWAWACVFLLIGGLGLTTVLWCVRPRFIWRLLELAILDWSISMWWKPPTYSGRSFTPPAGSAC